MKEIIVTDDLTIGYSDNIVLNRLNFCIPANTITALVGHNGAGKSTLINTLIGVLPPLSGKFTIRIPISKNRRRNPFNNIGFSPQSQTMDWYTTAYDNVLLGPLMAGYSLREAKKKAEQSLTIMGISNLKNAPVDHLSGGQQQRIQIARELARDPSLFILDEPTNGLDVETAEKLFTYIRSMAKHGGALISSHDLTIIERYADNLILLDHGELLYSGSMKKFMQNSSHNNQTVITFNVLVKDLQIQLPAEIKIVNHTAIFPGTFTLNSILSLLKQHISKINNIESVRPSLRQIYLSIRKGR
ncbi:MAG: ABC transporter ATP-binding protein [Sporolactobacillus sp.]|jgi:ABC-type multidrug transport system ATPase subunit|nr:ABC transporter ATP-binding protein [Sporolactobacillus sp.]